MLEWKKDGWKAAIALAPMLIILGIFTFYPIINTMVISFFPKYNYNFNSYGSFGFTSYGKVLGDPKFWNALGMTTLMVVVSVPLSIAVSLLITVVLNSIKKLRGFFQTIFFLPYVTNGIAFGLVFATIFSPQPSGLVNTLLNWFGCGPVSWTGEAAYVPVWAGITVITIYSVWNGLAFKILVFLGGIQGIDKQYYQAAQIDGASKARVFTKITLPLLSPMVLYITITSLIGAFKAYSSVVSLYGENMGNGSEGTFMTAVGYIYKYFGTIQKGRPENLSIAAAAAVILFVFILIITGLQMLYNKKRVHY
ncbi:MAG: sugar ABC transporter permease [Erysipelotrichaceae bacterium]|nr:sugar ABC transporter permease [Erysipelotrichaceae bacterium]